MDFDVLAYLSWREVLVAVVVLLVLYILFAFLRISRLKNEKMRVEEISLQAAKTGAAAYAAVQEPGEVSGAVENVVAELKPSAKTETFPWNEPPAERPDFHQIETLEQDIAQLRREIGGLRAEVQALRDEQRRELTKVQVAQNASPFYSEAMQMAMQGQDAADISVLCGISRGEAELVVALARNRDEPAH
jgi:vacuolar-type H+-ATPase subunit I/STV1